MYFESCSSRASFIYWPGSHGVLSFQHKYSVVCCAVPHMQALSDEHRALFRRAVLLRTSRLNNTLRDQLRAQVRAKLASQLRATARQAMQAANASAHGGGRMWAPAPLEHVPVGLGPKPLGLPPSSRSKSGLLSLEPSRSRLSGALSGGLGAAEASNLASQSSVGSVIKARLASANMVIPPMEVILPRVRDALDKVKQARRKEDQAIHRSASVRLQAKLLQQMQEQAQVERAEQEVGVSPGAQPQPQGAARDSKEVHHYVPDSAQVAFPVTALHPTVASPPSSSQTGAAQQASPQVHNILSLQQQVSQLLASQQAGGSRPSSATSSQRVTPGSILSTFDRTSTYSAHQDQGNVGAPTHDILRTSSGLGTLAELLPRINNMMESGAANSPRRTAAARAAAGQAGMSEMGRAAAAGGNSNASSSSNGTASESADSLDAAAALLAVAAKPPASPDSGMGSSNKLLSPMGASLDVIPE